MRKKKALLNMSFSFIYQVISIVCGLITPRLILLAFGSTYNGVISSATQFLGMINILTLGITGATRIALYKTLANKDKVGTSGIIKATNKYMMKVSIGVICYSIGLSLLYPLFSHNDLSFWQNASLIAIISVGVFAEYFFGITNRTLLQADQLSYINYIFDIIQIVLNTICAYILIKVDCSIYFVKLGSSIVFLISPILLRIFINKKYKFLKDVVPTPIEKKSKNAVAVHSISNIVHQNVDLVVLTLFTDAKMISVYTIYYLVVGKIRNLMQVFTSGMEAAFGDMWAKKETDSLKKNFSFYEFMLLSFGTVVFSCVGVLILPFIKLYTQGVTDVNYIRMELAILITLAEWFYCIRQPYLTLVYATGSYEETKKGAIVETALNIIISLVLVNFIGISGVIVGTIVANVFRTIQFSIFASKNILNRKITVAFTKILWSILTSSIIISLSIVACKNIEFSETWLGWVVQGIFVFTLSCSITITTALVCYRKDFIGLFKTFISAFSRKKRNNAQN